MPLKLLLGLFLACLIAYLAFRARALSRSGAAAAAVLGTVIFGLGGLPWAVLLLAFFISSSVLSRLFRPRKAGLDEKFSKGSVRDAGQVLANGGTAGLLALAGWAWAAGTAGIQTGALIWMAFAASLAAANADTWATELGVLSPRPPVLITNGRPVERGSSGGISLAGTLAALGGAALIAALAAIMGLLGWAPGGAELAWLALILITGGGLAGSLVDSLLGATIQAIYLCPSCQKETERHPLHSCGTLTTRIRGWPWFNNDWVNTACTFTSALLVLGLSSAFVPALQVNPVLSGETTMSIQISTSAFSPGATIPKTYTCDGENRSPDLSWSGLPAGTQSLALIVEDPDAPSGNFIHWVIYNLPPAATGLPAGQPRTPSLAGGGTQGTNDFRHSGYDGPCPPPGRPHRYFFRLYALDNDLRLSPGQTAPQLRKALAGHILGQGELMGRYGR